MSGDSTSTVPTYIPTGGIPGGFIRTQDSAAGGTMYWDAPAKFLGDNRDAYRGYLFFALRQSTTQNQFDAPDVILVGGGITLTYDTIANPGTVWSHYGVPLHEHGWRNGSRRATRAEMLTVLKSLTSLRIRAEFVDGPDVDDLDTVVIKTK